MEPDPQELGLYVAQRLAPGIAELQRTPVRGTMIGDDVYVNAGDLRAQFALVATIMVDEVAAQVDYHQMLASLGTACDTSHLTTAAALTTQIAALFIKHIPTQENT